MKKMLIASSLLLSVMAGSTTYAAGMEGMKGMKSMASMTEMVDTGGITVTNTNGLMFQSMLLMVDPINMKGSIEFVPSTPVGMPAMQGKPELPAGNTVGMLKNKIAVTIQPPS